MLVGVALVAPKQRLASQSGPGQRERAQNGASSPGEFRNDAE